MMDFIEESREAFGVEPICRTLQFAPSTYYDRRAVVRDPDRASARAKSDAAMSVKIDAAWDANRKLYGARKIWHVLRRQGEDAAPLSANACIRLPGKDWRGLEGPCFLANHSPSPSALIPVLSINRCRAPVLGRYGMATFKPF